MADLAGGLAKLGVEFANRPDVNMLFAYVDDKAADQLEAAGLLFYRMGGGTIRLVTSWQTTAEDVDAALAAFEQLLGARL
jgi:threonine aldolase